MRVRARVKDREFIFTTPLAKMRFMEGVEGKEVYIELDDAPTANMRRYFEGAMIPAIYYQHPKSGWIDFKDAREAIKLEFIPGYTRDLKGQRVKVARSTTELSKARFVALIESVTRWMTENGLEVPEPQDYVAWRDSAPPAHEVYPPLKRMQEVYNQARDDAALWRKKKVDK